MRRGIRLGDLTFAEARVGARIKCVVPADMFLWSYFCPLQSFEVPVVGGIYTIKTSGNTYEGEQKVLRGATLKEIDNPQVSIPIPNRPYSWSGEPFFLLPTFVLVTQ